MAQHYQNADAKGGTQLHSASTATTGDFPHSLSTDTPLTQPPVTMTTMLYLLHTNQS